MYTNKCSCRWPGPRVRATAFWLAASVTIVGCAGGDPASDAASPSLPADAAETAEAAEAESGGALEVVVDGGEGEQSASTSSGDAQATDDSGSSAGSDPSADGGSGNAPPPVASGWVLVIAGASDPYDPILTDTLSEIGDLGFDSRISNCDQGAAEAIGMSPDGTFTLSAPFASEAAAVDAAAVLASSQIDSVAAEIVVACPE